MPTAKPHKSGGATAGGNVKITQTTPEQLTIRMNGAVSAAGKLYKEAAAHLHFDLKQDFKVVFKKSAQGLQGQTVSGRAPGRACCREGNAKTAALLDITTRVRRSAVGRRPCCLCASTDIRLVVGRIWQSTVRKGPICIDVRPACYTLAASFLVDAMQSCTLPPKRAAVADFNTGGIDQSARGDAFPKVDRKDFGFVITLRVVAQ